MCLAILPANTWQDPSLWFGIGVLYDRCSSYENAEEAFSWVLKVVRIHFHDVASTFLRCSD